MAFRDVITGLFTTRKDAEARPHQTTKETFRRAVDHEILRAALDAQHMNPDIFQSHDILYKAIEKVLKRR